MSEDSTDGVSIRDGSAFVRLTRHGEPRGPGMTTALIEVKGGPFTGTVLDDTLVGISEFCEQLAALYDRLGGTATLSSYETFKMVVKGDGRGAISVSVDIHEERSRLCFGMEIDQTFLPNIIRGLKTEFPDG